MQSTFWKVWATPLVIGVLSLVGLLAALTGDGVWDLVSWVTLGLPVLVTFWFLGRMKKEVSGKR